MKILMRKLLQKIKSKLTYSQKMKIINFIYSRNFLRDYFFLKLKGITWDKTMRFHGLPIIHNKGKILVGSKFVCCSKSSENSIGVFQRVIIKSLRENSLVSIGENVQVSGSTISSASSIEIGNNVLIGSGVLITDGDAHPIDVKSRLSGGPGIVKRIKIGDNVFIGARSIILKGVTIGNNSIIGAGSVVTKSFPDNCLLAGNPAKFIKNI